MPMIKLTSNYTDRSNNHGFQFEFNCDKCRNGHMSPFKPNTVGIASSVLKAAGSFFGGALSRAAYAGNHVKDALRGKARDDAYLEAVEEAKTYFKNCSRCGKWVCPEQCWNAARGLCEACAPDLAEEAAHIQATVAVDQAREKARKVDQTAGLDMAAQRMVACPHCNARVEGGKFCPECGKTLTAKSSCGKCGAEMGAKAKFCPECGTSRA